MSPWVWDTVRSEWFGFLQTFRTRASILHQGSENTKVAPCCADENDDDCFSLGCCCCLLPLFRCGEIYYSNLASYNGCSSKFELACSLNSACLIARFSTLFLPAFPPDRVVERGTMANMWCGGTLTCFIYILDSSFSSSSKFWSSRFPSISICS